MDKFKEELSHFQTFMDWLTFSPGLKWIILFWIIMVIAVLRGVFL